MIVLPSTNTAGVGNSAPTMQTVVDEGQNVARPVSSVNKDRLWAAIRGRRERLEGKAPLPPAPDPGTNGNTAARLKGDLPSRVATLIAGRRMKSADLSQEIAPQIADKTQLPPELSQEVIDAYIHALVEPAVRDPRAHRELERIAYGKQAGLLNVYFNDRADQLLICEKILPDPSDLPRPEPKRSIELLHRLIPEGEAGVDAEKLKGFLRRAAAVIPAPAIELIGSLSPTINMATPGDVLPGAARKYGRAFVSYWWALNENEPAGRYGPGVNELTLSAKLSTSGRDGANAAVYALMGALDFALGDGGLSLSSDAPWQDIWRKAQTRQGQPLGACSGREYFAKVATALMMPLSPSASDVPVLTTRARLLKEHREAHDFVLDALCHRVPERLGAGGAQDPQQALTAEYAYLQQARRATKQHRSADDWLQIATTAYAMGALQHDEELLSLAERSIKAHEASQDGDKETSTSLLSAIARTRNFMSGPKPTSVSEDRNELLADFAGIFTDFRIERIAEHFGLTREKAEALRNHPDRIAAAEELMHEEAEEQTQRMRQQTLRPGPSVGDAITGLSGHVKGEEVLDGERYLRLRVKPPLFIYNEKHKKGTFPFGEFKYLEESGKTYGSQLYRWRAEADLDDYVYSAFTVYVRTDSTAPVGSHIVVDGVVGVVDTAKAQSSERVPDVKGIDRAPDKRVIVTATCVEEDTEGNTTASRS